MNNRLRAFSIIEVLFYVSMVSVFIIVLSTFWASLMQVQEKGRAMSTVDSEALFILNKINESIRNADSITSPSIGSSSSTLSLAFTDSSRNPTIFNLNSSNIQVSEGSLSYTNINSSRVIINNIVFSNMTGPDSKGSIKIQLDLSFVNPDNSINSNYSQTYYGAASLR